MTYLIIGAGTWTGFCAGWLAGWLIATRRLRVIPREDHHT